MTKYQKQYGPYTIERQHMNASTIQIMKFKK